MSYIGIRQSKVVPKYSLSVVPRVSCGEGITFREESTARKHCKASNTIEIVLI